MKPGIHPDYGKVAFRDQSTGEISIIGSTMTSDERITVDGEELPLVSVDITSASHPFWTGQHREIDSEGRIQKWRRRYGAR